MRPSISGRPCPWWDTGGRSPTARSCMRKSSNTLGKNSIRWPVCCGSAGPSRTAPVVVSQVRSLAYNAGCAPRTVLRYLFLTCKPTEPRPIIWRQVALKRCSTWNSNGISGRMRLACIQSPKRAVRRSSSRQSSSCPHICADCGFFQNRVSSEPKILGP